MGWRAENTVMVLGAILVGTVGAVWLSPAQLLLGPGVLVLPEVAEAPRVEDPAIKLQAMVAAVAVAVAVAASHDEEDAPKKAAEAAAVVRQDRAQPAFVANSMSSGFSVRGSYRGTPTFTQHGVAVELSRAMATSDGSEDTQRLVGIRLSLAERSASGGWHIVERGPLYEVGVDMSDPTRWSKWGTLQLDLPDVDFPDLEGRWFVIEHELWVDSGPDGEGHSAFTYAHADPSATLWLMDTFHGC